MRPTIVEASFVLCALIHTIAPQKSPAKSEAIAPMYGCVAHQNNWMMHSTEAQENQRRSLSIRTSTYHVSGMKTE